MKTRCYNHQAFENGVPFSAGAYYDEVPPVPIPNTEVKLISAENTRRAASREDRSMPTQIPVKLTLGRSNIPQ